MLEAIQHCACMPHVVVIGHGVNQDVVNVCKDIAPDHIPEGLIYEGLKDGWDVGQVIGHDKVFVMPLCGVKSGLPLVPLTDPD